METYNALTTLEQQRVYIALELGDVDFAWSILQDQDIYLEVDELQEVAEHFNLIEN